MAAKQQSSGTLSQSASTSIAQHPLSLALGGLLAMAAALGIGRFVYTPILPFMVDALGLSKSEAGLIASANYLGYMLGAIIAGLSIIKGSRRRWLLAGLLVSALTTLLSGATTALGAIIAIRFIGGLASAFVMVFASTLILERLANAERSELTAVHFGGVGIGITVSAILVSILASQGLGWRYHWGASGVLALAALIAVAFLVPDRTETEKTQATGSPNPGLTQLILAYGLFGFGYVITATFIVAILRATPSISHLETWIWVIVGLSAAPSLWFWSLIARRIGSLKAFAVACLIEAVGVAASVLWIAPAGMILAGALLGGTFIGITALGLIAARRMAGGDPRPILAQMTAAFGLGQIIGPALAGFLHDVSSSFLGSSLIATAALLIAALLAFRSDAKLAFGPASL